MGRKRKNTGSSGSCFMFLFVYWWLYPLKWIFYDLPKAIISTVTHSIQSMPKKVDMPDIEYENTRQYGDYAITRTGNYTLNNVEGQISQYKQQAEERTHLCERTCDPTVFFYSYDFAIKRYIDIMYMARYAKVPSVYMDYAENEYKFALNMKQKAISLLIDRCSNATYEKICSLKTIAAKMKHADKFQFQFYDFTDEISPENQKKIMDLSEYLHSVAGK